MSRKGIAKVRIIITCDEGHETPWTFDSGDANGGDAYCDECDATNIWRGVTFNAYSDEQRLTATRTHTKEDTRT